METLLEQILKEVANKLKQKLQKTGQITNPRTDKLTEISAIFGSPWKTRDWPSLNILIYKILYKTLIGAKPLLIRFDEINGFIRVYDAFRYLVLFGDEKYDFIYNRIIYLIRHIVLL